MAPTTTNTATIRNQSGRRNQTRRPSAAGTVGLSLCLTAALLLLDVAGVAEAFQANRSAGRALGTPRTGAGGSEPHPLQQQQQQQRQLLRGPDPLYIFGRKNNDGGDSGDASNDESPPGKTGKRSIPFFGRLKNRGSSGEASSGASGDNQRGEDLRASNPATATATATATAARSTPPPEAARPRKPKEPVTPEDLRLMAEKARLEAEKLDAELTLSKIEKLEAQLLRSKQQQRNGETPQKAVEDLQYELDVLQAKVRGEPVPVKKPEASSSASSSSSAAPATTAASAETSTGRSDPGASRPSGGASVQLPKATIETVVSRDPIVEIDNASVLEAAKNIAAQAENTVSRNFESEEDLEGVPDFLLNILASFVDMKPDPKIDRAEFWRRWESILDLDYSFYEKDPPEFTPAQIRKKKVEILEWGAGNKTIEAVGWYGGTTGEADDLPLVVTETMVQKADGNATQIAVYSLEYDYYFSAGGDAMKATIEEIVPDILGDALKDGSYFGQMYPKCVNNRGENKGDDYVSEEPTTAMMDSLTQAILPAVRFSASAKPYKVPGGYAITGSHKYENGDLLLEAIDLEIQRSRPSLSGQITVLYTPKYGPLETPASVSGESLTSMESLMQDSSLDVFADNEPILFVAGPNLTREANPIGLVTTSILGLATSWYLSVYPFVLNDKIASRIDSDLQLLDANLQPDLSYLTDLSVPLFYCFMGLQLVHELAHRLTAMSRGVELSVPVFVPSFITGITSTVTTFKSLPRNKQDMFDVAASGPLAGIVASSIALAIGAQLTIVADPATLPALPLEILRQSTLGGAIIDAILPGSLYVPDGAPTGGIFVPLHPFALAGYVGLIVNALALLPIGTTDGGRLTMALFDRAEKMSIGTLTLMALLWAGLFGSDLFLFYFSFCLAFQTGNEIPARNEQDPVDFSRVIVAVVCYGLAILTLVPVQ
ncbi:unnamed protein product [Pseudo-nitzschia multistriata]|uniref:Peptidase M50 domain-containing protein n=1 Tax=Pseudo-nitzschia multistriata TaxID=183589 RepID=A0A448Z9S2_9STRA|nr:unnamed protein product [Pseudo-nitzschia multistriata]